MPYNPQSDIAKMMMLYGQEVKSQPELPDRATLLLRARLVLEEALEFVKACGCCAVISDKNVGTIHDRIEVVDLDIEPDLVEYADACGDQLVVTYGALNAAGIDVSPLWDEILRSNKAKVWSDGTIHRREDGKVQKPMSWQPPNILRVLVDQGFQVDASPLRNADDLSNSARLENVPDRKP